MLYLKELQHIIITWAFHGWALLCFPNLPSFGRLVRKNHRLLLLSKPRPVRHGSGISTMCFRWAESTMPKHHHLIRLTSRRMPGFPRLVNPPPPTLNPPSRTQPTPRPRRLPQGSHLIPMPLIRLYRRRTMFAPYKRASWGA